MHCFRLWAHQGPDTHASRRQIVVWVNDQGLDGAEKRMRKYMGIAGWRIASIELSMTVSVDECLGMNVSQRHAYDIAIGRAIYAHMHPGVEDI